MSRALTLAIAFAMLAVAALAEVPTAVEKELIEADLAFGRVSAARGLDGWLSFFADDAAIFPTSGPIVEGIAAIRDHYRKIGFTPEGLTWTPTRAAASSGGDLGYTFGTWEWHGKAADGTEQHARGKYTTIWRRDRAGSWKVVVDIGNSAPAQ